MAAVRELQNVSDGSGLQVYHLVEKRFAERFGWKAGDIPGIVVTFEEHVKLTNLWRGAIGHVGDLTEIDTLSASLDDVWTASQKIYAEYPELLEAIANFIGKPTK